MSTATLPKLSIQVPSSDRGITRIENLLQSIRSIWNLGEDSYNKIRSAVYETLQNAIRSKAQKPGDEGTVHIEMVRTADSCEVIIEDEEKPVDKRSLESKGMQLVKKLASKLMIIKNGKAVRMVFDIR